MNFSIVEVVYSPSGVYATTTTTVNQENLGEHLLFDLQFE